MVEDSILYYQSVKESIPQRQPLTKLPFTLAQSSAVILPSCQSVEESLESIPTLHQIPLYESQSVDHVGAGILYQSRLESMKI